MRWSAGVFRRHAYVAPAPVQRETRPDRYALSLLGKHLSLLRKQQQKRRCYWPRYDHHDRSDIGKPFSPLSKPLDLCGSFVVAQCQQRSELTDDQIHPNKKRAHCYPLSSSHDRNDKEKHLFLPGTPLFCVVFVVSGSVGKPTLGHR